MSAFVVVSPRAQKQIEDIDLEIQSRSQERADEFLRVLNTKVQQLAQFPESGVIHRGNIRRLLLLRFPYSPSSTRHKTLSASSPAFTPEAPHRSGVRSELISG